MSVCRSSSMKLAGFSCFSCIFSFLAAGKPVQIGSPEQVPAVSGDDVILPCTLNASIKPSGVLVEWSRVDRSPPVTVHVSRNGKELVKEKAKAYLGRTAMMEDSSSLKLYGVRHHDNGTYRCHVRQPEMEKEVFVSLIVAEVGDVWMVIHRTSAGRLLLSCESSGWNPPPVLTLLDAQRNVLAKMESASIGPDSLYGVRSGMDEALANGNGTLICRVEIPELELAKESRMILSDEFIQSEGGFVCHVVWIVAMVLVFVVAFVLLFFVPLSAMEKLRSSVHRLIEFVVSLFETMSTTGSAEPLLPAELRYTEYGDISRMKPTGASDDTARANQLHSRGVAASNELAKKDLEKMKTYRDTIVSVADAMSVHPALIAAIISRQSQAGSSLRPDGFGQYDHNSFGLMQINKNYHAVKGAPFSWEHVDQGVTFLIQAYKSMSRNKPDWTKEQQLAGALAAYVAGEDRVLPLEHDAVDSVTPYSDFANDVLARAQWFSCNGF